MTQVLKAIRSGSPGTLFSAFLYFDVSFMIWILLGPLSVYICRDIDLTPAQKGFLVAVPILSGAILRIFAGILTDQIGPRRTGLLGLALTAVPLFWGWQFADSLRDLAAVGILLGVAGASFAVALPLASRCYPPEHQGIAMGIAGAGNSGTVVTALLAPRLAESIGWQAVMGLALIPVAITFAIFHLLARDSASAAPARTFRDYAALLRERDCWWFNFFYSVTFGGFVGLTSFLVLYYHEAYGLSRVAAGNLTALCVFAGSFFRPVGGYLADRFEGVKVLSVLFPVIAVLMSVASFGLPVWAVTMVLVAAMAALGMGNGCIFQIVPRRFQNEMGLVTGIVGACGGIGGFFLPTLFGGLKEFTNSYHDGFAVYALLPLAAVILLQTVYHRSWSRTWLAKPAPVRPDVFGRVRMEVVFGG